VYTDNVDESPQHLSRSKDSGVELTMIIHEVAEEPLDDSQFPNACHDVTEDDTFADNTEDQSNFSVLSLLFRVLLVLLCLYCFVCSLDLLGSAFKLMGGETAGKVFSQNKIISNPVAGLMIGVLVTVLLQSSSTSSSLVVAMVASSFISVETAVPIIMGANIGTSVTNTIVALSQIQDEKMFERAFAAATVHDMFNILTVLILLPFEWITHGLTWLSNEIVEGLSLTQSENAEVQLLSRLTDPVTDFIVTLNKTYIKQIAKGEPVGNDEQVLKKFCDDAINVTHPAFDSSRDRCDSLLSRTDLSDKAAGAILLIASLFTMFACLIVMVKLLKSIFHGHISVVINKTVNADFPGKLNFLTGYVAIFVGVVMTVLVQSSSIFTSTLTPLVGLNIITLERAFPLTLGSNIGTTVTSMLAALASDSNFDLALQISLCHLLFNVIGILIWYPIPKMRAVPLGCARHLGVTTCKYRWFAFAYVGFVFVLVPALIFALSLAGTTYVVAFCSMVLLIACLIASLKLAQSCCSESLPPKMRDFGFLPKWMRSLEPFHNLCVGLINKLRPRRSMPVRASLTRTRRVTESSHHLTPDDEELDYDSPRKDKPFIIQMPFRASRKSPINAQSEYDVEAKGLEVSNKCTVLGFDKLYDIPQEDHIWEGRVYKGKEATENLGKSVDSGVPSSSSSSSSKNDLEEEKATRVVSHVTSV